MAIAVLAVLGLGGICAGAFFQFKELTRKPTTAELEVAAEREVALRWRNWPVEKLFPATLTFQHGDLKDTAKRIGAAPQANCGESVDKPVADILTTHGCRAVLRATYVDSSGAGVVTLGVVVMRDMAAAKGAIQDLGATGRKGVRAIAFPNTVAERFGDAQRQTFVSDHVGNYVVLATAGYADGRGTLGSLDNESFFLFADRARTALQDLIGKEIPPCKSGGVQC